MRKISLILILFLIIGGKSFGQFSLDKFLDEKIVVPDRTINLNMEELLKNAVDAKLNKIAIKIVDAKLKNGMSALKTISNAVIKDEDAKKLNDYLYAKLKTKFGKPDKENVVNNVANNLWVKKDGTRYMLTYSGNTTMLMVIKK